MISKELQMQSVSMCLFGKKTRLIIYLISSDTSIFFLSFQSLLRKYSNRFCKNPKMRSDESPQCVIHIFHAATRRIHNSLFPYAAIGSVIAFPLLHHFSRLWVAKISFHS